MNDTETIQAGVVALLEKTGFVMSCERIQARTDGGCGMPDGAGHWRIHFTPVKSTQYGRPISLEYSVGTGHRVWNRGYKYVGAWRGQFHTKPRLGGRVDMIRPTIFAVDMVDRYTTYPEPHPADILYSCILDSSACDMCRAEWCGEYGYDTDSIKADRVYRQCQDIGYKLRGMFGQHWAPLAEIVQEY